jgi:hypothetical protein
MTSWLYSLLFAVIVLALFTALTCFFTIVFLACKAFLLFSPFAFIMFVGAALIGITSVAREHIFDDD